jgi:hypothetical protein
MAQGVDDKNLIGIHSRSFAIFRLMRRVVSSRDLRVP